MRRPKPCPTCKHKAIPYKKCESKNCVNGYLNTVDDLLDEDIIEYLKENKWVLELHRRGFHTYKRSSRKNGKPEFKLELCNDGSFIAWRTKSIFPDGEDAVEGRIRNMKATIDKWLG